MIFSTSAKRVLALLVCAAASLLLNVAPSRAAGLQYTGVNLSGAEFGQGNLPGTFGTDYTYPTNAEVDYFMGKGMNVFRLPIRWERLQTTANASLNSAELARLNAFVTYATGKGASVIVEPHNFERYFPQTSNFQSSAAGLIGGATANTQGTVVTDAVYQDFWGKVATQFKSNSRVMFGLMNEPNAVQETTLVASNNAAISAIRATGAQNLILVPGNRFTGAWTWTNSDSNGASNATAMLGIVDSGNNYAFDVHQYFDSNGSGTSTSIAGNDTNLGVSRLTAFTNWLKTNNKRGFLGEFAVGNSTVGSGAAQIGDELVDNMLDYMEANSDVWMGWTWWGGGPWWNNYIFQLDPTNLGQGNQGADQAALSALTPHMVPEPASLTLLGVGSLVMLRRRRARRS